MKVRFFIFLKISKRILISCLWILLSLFSSQSFALPSELGDCSGSLKKVTNRAKIVEPSQLFLDLPKEGTEQWSSIVEAVLKDIYSESGNNFTVIKTDDFISPQERKFLSDWLSRDYAFLIQFDSGLDGPEMGSKKGSRGDPIDMEETIVDAEIAEPLKRFESWLSKIIDNIKDPQYADMFKENPELGLRTSTPDEPGPAVDYFHVDGNILSFLWASSGTGVGLLRDTKRYRHHEPIKDLGHRIDEIEWASEGDLVLFTGGDFAAKYPNSIPTVHISPAHSGSSRMLFVWRY